MGNVAFVALERETGFDEESKQRITQRIHGKGPQGESVRKGL